MTLRIGIPASRWLNQPPLWGLHGIRGVNAVDPQCNLALTERFLRLSAPFSLWKKPRSRRRFVSQIGPPRRSGRQNRRGAFDRRKIVFRLGAGAPQRGVSFGPRRLEGEETDDV